MRPTVRYSLKQTAAYAIDKSIIRTLYDFDAIRRHPLLHIDTKSAFTTEIYAHNRPFYVHKLSRFHSSSMYSNKPNGKLRLNL